MSSKRLFAARAWLGRLFAGGLFRGVGTATAPVVHTLAGTWQVPTRTGTWQVPARPATWQVPTRTGTWEV